MVLYFFVRNNAGILGFYVRKNETFRSLTENITSYVVGTDILIMHAKPLLRSCGEQNLHCYMTALLLV